MEQHLILHWESQFVTLKHKCWLFHTHWSSKTKLMTNPYWHLKTKVLAFPHTQEQRDQIWMIRRPPKPDPQQHLKTRAGACVMKWAFYVTLSFFRWQFFQFSVSPTLQCYNAQCLSDLLLLFHTHVWRQMVIALRRPFVIFYRTQVNASYSTWWPTLQTMQVAPPDDQMLNQSKLVAKYATYTSGANWWPNLLLMQVAPSGGQINN